MTRASSDEADLCGMPKKVCVKRVSARIMKNRWGELVMNHGGMRIDDEVKTRSVVSVAYEADGVLKTNHDDQVVGPRTAEGHRLLLSFDYRRPLEHLVCGVTLELDMTRDGRLNSVRQVMYGWVTNPIDDMAGRLDVPYTLSAD